MRFFYFGAVVVISPHSRSTGNRLGVCRADTRGGAFRSVTAGREAQGEVLVRVRSNSSVYSGRGISTDILEASVKAYLQALNEAWSARQTAESAAIEVEV